MAEKLEYRPGTLIPGTKYQIVRKLGAGGMGTVYEVEDVSVEKRFVLKTIHVKYAGHQVAVDRFVREAKALGKLEHKNIVQVVTAGVTGDGLQLRYFVMEKLVGHSLRAVLDSKGALGFDTACRFMIELMSALNCAHDVGIIHRDIKPENIFIARDSVGVTTLKLLDFGIMTSTDTRTSDRRGFMGTARYAAPEQLSATHEATPSSDLYSATLVFYELVCGTGPFDDAEEIPELMEAHRTKAPPAPSTFRPEIPASLEALILRGLAKNPAERPVDAFSYAEEVNAVLREFRETRTPLTSNVAREPVHVTPRAAPKKIADAHDTIEMTSGAIGATMRMPSGPIQIERRAPVASPALSMTAVDEEAAKHFARAASSKEDVSGTMGATHSTMPTQRNRAWIVATIAIVVAAATLFARPIFFSRAASGAIVNPSALPVTSPSAPNSASTSPSSAAKANSAK